MNTWGTTIEAYCAWLRAGGASTETIRLRRSYIRRLSECAGACGPWEVDHGLLIQMLGVEHWAPETRQSARSSMRNFYRWGVESDYELSPDGGLEYRSVLWQG